jgi:subtilisin family serine protease
MAVASVERKRCRPLLPVSLVAAVLLVLVLVAPSASKADDAALGPDPEVVPGELVVGFDDQASDSLQRRTVQKAGGQIEDTVDSIDGLIVTPRGSRTTDQVAALLTNADPVEFVEPNYVLKHFRTPNDAAFGREWGLQNSGQLGGKAGADINATAAWDVTTGGDVTVAILDTGIAYNHPDIIHNMWRNPAELPNGVDDDNNGFVDDIYGADFKNDDSDPNDDSSHGTHVAGIVGAEGNNGIGSVGVNWNVHLMALKFLDNNGAGNTANAAEAIDYAVKAGARVINASWGGPAYSFALYKAIRNAGNAGVLVVAAAGNEGANSDTEPEYPASSDLPNVISVAATDAGDGLVDFSNYGARTVDLAAPGDDIYSTVPKFANPSGYASFSGTSMAAPFVSGAAALYLSHTPSATVAQVRDALLQSVDPLPSLAGKTVTGGRLDVGRALGAVQPPPPPAASPSSDSTAPSPFRLIRPRNRYTTTRHGVRFRWQRSVAARGLRYYKLYVDGKRRRTVHDPDARPGGREPTTRVHIHLRRGRHRWFVRAYDYAGHTRKSRRSRRGSHSTRVLFVDKRHQR